MLYVYVKFSVVYRFSKARKYDVKRTAEMWKNMLAWRKEFETDSIEEVCIDLRLIRLGVLIQ